MAKKKRNVSIEAHGGRTVDPTDLAPSSSTAGALVFPSESSPLSPSLVAPPRDDDDGCAATHRAMRAAQPTLLHYWRDHLSTSTAVVPSHPNAAWHEVEKEEEKEEGKKEVHMAETMPLVTRISSSLSHSLLLLEEEEEAKNEGTVKEDKQEKKSVKTWESRSVQLVHSMHALTSLLIEWGNERHHYGHEEEQEQENENDLYHKREEEDVCGKKKKRVKEAWDRLVKVGKRVL